MSKDFDDIVDNLRHASAWIRIVFMLAFAVVLYLIIAPVVFVLMIAQALFSVITGSSNENLRFLGAALARYVLQILEFITYNSENKPFPFSDFPKFEGDASSSDQSSEEQQAGGAAKETAQKKTTGKKAATKKTAAKKTARKKDNGAKR